jgi:hypothetical protein
MGRSHPRLAYSSATRLNMRTVQKKSCRCSMTFLWVPSCHLWLSFPIMRDDGDHGNSLRLAQFSPRRKHETVHRSSACGVRIRRHTRGHVAGDFLLGRRLADDHFPLAGNRYIGRKRKSDFALHSADNAKAAEMRSSVPVPACSAKPLQSGRAHGSGPSGLPGASPGTPLKSTPEIFRGVETLSNPEAFAATNSTTVTVQAIAPASNCIQFKEFTRLAHSSTLWVCTRWSSMCGHQRIPGDCTPTRNASIIRPT